MQPGNPAVLVYTKTHGHENSDRQRCVGATNQRCGHHVVADRSSPEAVRPHGARGDAGPVPYVPLSDLSGNPCGAVSLSADGAAHRGLAAAGAAYRHRRTPGLRGAPLLCAPWAAVHDLLPHAVSAISAPALSGSNSALLPGPA